MSIRNLLTKLESKIRATPGACPNEVLGQPKFIDVIRPGPRPTVDNGGIPRDGTPPEMVTDKRRACPLCGQIHGPAFIEIVRYADEQNKPQYP